ncbi:MAG: Pyrroline-5-carboxylate reductase [Candidatus Omnitrophica bacterium]|nr:Pyrroline-5-carboxylate reductase [Candidatus Omnitrophota bacterium]
MSAKTVLSGVRIAVLGAGNMGQALVRGLVDKSVYPQYISVYDPDPKKIALLKKDANIRAAKTSRQAVSLADVVILAVKPQTLPEVCAEVSSGLPAGALVVSIAAGVTISGIEKHFKKPLPVIRVMPNMPAQVGQGISAYSVGRHATAKHRKIAEAVLAAFGEVVPVPEKMLDLVTAISGSGPAYFFLLAEKLIESAYEMGMKADTAKKLAYHTALGSGRVMMQTWEDPEDLIAKVASKGGTTEAALKTFKRLGFGKVVQEAVKAAHRRSRELSEGRS